MTVGSTLSHVNMAAGCQEQLVRGYQGGQGVAGGLAGGLAVGVAALLSGLVATTRPSLLSTGVLGCNTVRLTGRSRGGAWWGGGLAGRGCDGDQVIVIVMAS